MATVEVVLRLDRLHGIPRGALSLLWLIPYSGVSQVGGGVCSFVQPSSAPSQLISVALRNGNHSFRRLHPAVRTQCRKGSRDASSSMVTGWKHDISLTAVLWWIDDSAHAAHPGSRQKAILTTWVWICWAHRAGVQGREDLDAGGGGVLVGTQGRPRPELVQLLGGGQVVVAGAGAGEVGCCQRCGSLASDLTACREQRPPPLSSRNFQRCASGLRLRLQDLLLAQRLTDVSSHSVRTWR